MTRTMENMDSTPLISQTNSVTILLVTLEYKTSFCNVSVMHYLLKFPNNEQCNHYVQA